MLFFCKIWCRHFLCPGYRDKISLLTIIYITPLAAFVPFPFSLLRIKSSSSSCYTASTDLPNPLSSPVSIIHYSREVFKFYILYRHRAVIYIYRF